MDRANVVTPISPTDVRMSTRKNANVMPTANASMLVATASITSSRRSSLPSAGQDSSSSSSWKASHSIFPPMRAKSTKAIQ